MKNSTQNTFQLKLWLDETHLNVTLLSKENVESEYRIEERNHQIRQQYWGGYTRHNQIFQIQKLGDQYSEKVLVENHAIMMYDPFLKS